MKMPPLLLGCALLFWGWETGTLLIAVPAAALIEGVRWTRWRFELEPDHYLRLWNLSVLLALGLGLQLFFTQGGYAAVNDLVGQGQPGVRGDSLKNMGNLVLRWLQLLPGSMLLFVAAHAAGTLTDLPTSTFSLIVRRRVRRAQRPGAAPFREARVNPSYAFLILLLLAVSASRAHPTWYFPGVAGLITWTLWSRRAPAFRPRAFGMALAAAIGLGFATQTGLVYLQKRFEAWQSRLMERIGSAKEFDTSQTRTAMGQIGRMKLSGQILWRLKPGHTNPPSLLLEAAFNQYEQPTNRSPKGAIEPPSWTTALRRFADSNNGRRDPTWLFNREGAPEQAITLTGYTRNGEVNIPHPLGTIMITDLTSSILSIQTNAMGAARTIDARTLAILEMWYGPNGGFAARPYEDDLDLSRLVPADARAVRLVASRLKLSGADPGAALARIQLFFFNGFTYSLDEEAPPAGSTNNTPLSNFLLTRHEGHCEHFATATTLLLRAAGIPARYAVGYSVQERYAGNEYVIRERHAHSWTLAWIRGRWIEVDNTPAGWFEADWAGASPWEAQVDWLSDAWLAFYRWRQSDNQFRLYVLIGGVLALGYLAWRQVAGRSWRRTRGSTATNGAFAGLGLDSEFYLIERQLGRTRPRLRSEPVSAWLRRQTFPSPELERELGRLLELHYRLRFDPAGLPPAERAQLREGVGEWLLRFARQSAA